MSKKIDNPAQPKKPAEPKTSKRVEASTVKKPATRKKSATPKVSGNGKVSQKKSTKNATKTEKTTTPAVSKKVDAEVQANKQVEENVSLDDLIESNFGDLVGELAELGSDAEKNANPEDFGDDVLRHDGKSANSTTKDSATIIPVKDEDEGETEEDYEPRNVDTPEVGNMAEVAAEKDIKNIPVDNPKEGKQEEKQEEKDHNSPTNNGSSENGPGNDIDAIAAQKEAAVNEAAQKWTTAYNHWNTVFDSVKNAAKAAEHFPDSEVRQANLASKQAELQEVKNELADAIKALKKVNEVEPGDSFDAIVAKKEAAVNEATQKWEAANKRCNSVSIAARSAANAAARFPNDEAKQAKSASKQAELKAAKETLDTAIKELKKAKKEADEVKQQAAEVAAQQADEAAAQKPAEAAAQQSAEAAVQQASEGTGTKTEQGGEAAGQSVQNDDMNKLIENRFGDFFASDGAAGANSQEQAAAAAAAAADAGASVAAAEAAANGGTGGPADGSSEGNPLTGGHTGSFDRPTDGSSKPPNPDDSGTKDENGQDSNGTVKPIPLVEILRKAAQDESVNYTNVAQFITMLEPSVVKSLSSKYYEDDCLEDCKSFVTFLSELLNLNSYREVSIILSEVVAYIKKNAGVTLSAMNIIMYCNELNKNITDRKVLDISGIGYTKIRIMVENAFIINYLKTAGVSLNLAVGNNVDTYVNNMVLLAASTAYSIYGYMLGDISDKYAIAFQRIETEKPEMLSVVTEGDYGAFYKMLKTFSGYSTVGIDLNDIDLNIDSYSPGEAASLYAAVIAKMDELAARYHKTYEKEDIERVVDSVASRGYRASQSNVIEYYCDEVLNPKKPKGEGNAKDSISVDHGMNFATRAFIPSGYGLSKSHIEISKPYTEVFGIPFINIRHPLFRTIAMKYSNRFSTAEKQSKGKTTATERAWAKRLHEVMVNADKAERQLVKEIKQGSLMSKFLVGDKTKDTQVEGEGLGFMSTIEKGLRKVTSFASNPKLVKNILKLIKLAIDGIETPVSRSTLVIATDAQHAYDMNPIVPNDVNDQYAHVRVFNPVKPEKTAAVSKKYLKQFYDIVNPLENADEYIACGAFSSNLPAGVGGNGMFRSQLQTISGGVIDPSSVPDSAITAFRQDIMQHNGYPFTYVLTDQSTGGSNDVYKIVRNNNFFGDLVRLDVDLVAIHVKKGSIDGIFIMENRDAEVLFS